MTIKALINGVELTKEQLEEGLKQIVVKETYQQRLKPATPNFTTGEVVYLDGKKNAPRIVLAIADVKAVLDNLGKDEAIVFVQDDKTLFSFPKDRYKKSPVS